MVLKYFGVEEIYCNNKSQRVLKESLELHIILADTVSKTNT